MPFVSVRARVVTDSTGAFTEIPVLLTPAGVLTPLMEYCLAHSHTRSLAWMRKVLLSTTLFLRYSQANPDEPDSFRLFQNFAQRLYTGTFDRETNLDQSSLCWHPRSTNSVGEIIGQLTDLFDWIGRLRPEARTINPQHVGGAFDRRIDQAAYLFRREKAFLGHTWATNPSTNDKGHSTRPKRQLNVAKNEPPAFPDNRFEELLFKGFQVGGNYDYRGMLISLLQHGAGFRVSEPFHLYVTDVFPDPSNSQVAVVQIHHPSFGKAPSNWIDGTGQKRNGNRITFLAEKYALAPRTEILGNRGAGWKNPRLDEKYFMRAWWFQTEYGEWFQYLWLKYLDQVARLDRNHPFAFINIDREPRGEVYTINMFKKAHAAAVARIGLVASKAAGTTPHGHRHAYAQRLRRAGMDKFLIQRFMHHAVPESQEIYTGPTMEEIISELEKAGSRMQQSVIQSFPMSLPSFIRP